MYIDKRKSEWQSNLPGLKGLRNAVIQKEQHASREGEATSLLLSINEMSPRKFCQISFRSLDFYPR